MGQRLKSSRRAVEDKRQPRAAPAPDQEALRLAKARCAEIAMLARAKGWDKKPR